jgi:hypothetical protein
MAFEPGAPGAARSGADLVAAVDATLCDLEEYALRSLRSLGRRVPDSAAHLALAHGLAEAVADVRERTLAGLLDTTGVLAESGDAIAVLWPLERALARVASVAALAWRRRLGAGPLTSLLVAEAATQLRPERDLFVPCVDAPPFRVPPRASKAPPPSSPSPTPPQARGAGLSRVPARAGRVGAARRLGDICGAHKPRVCVEQQLGREQRRRGRCGRGRAPQHRPERVLRDCARGARGAPASAA